MDEIFKIEVDFREPTWIKGIRVPFRHEVGAIFLNENYHRVLNFVFNYQEKFNITIATQKTNSGVTLFLKEENHLIYVADRVRNIRVAMHNDKRMSARVVK